MIRLPDGRWVRSDNLQSIGAADATRHYIDRRTLDFMERSITEEMCLVIPQIDVAKRVLAKLEEP